MVLLPKLLVKLIGELLVVVYINGAGAKLMDAEGW